MNNIATYITPMQIEIPMVMDHTGSHWKTHERALRLLTRKLQLKPQDSFLRISRKAYAVRKAHQDGHLHIFICAEPVDSEGFEVGLGGVIEEVLVEKYANSLYARVGRVICADGSGKVYEVQDNEYEWMLDKTSSAGQEFVKEVKKHLHKFDSDDNWVDASEEL